MTRALTCTLLIAFLSTGCGKPQMDMDMSKPEPYPELAKLEPLVGRWTGTAEMVEPSPAEMKAMMEEMMKNMPEGQMMPEEEFSFMGGETYEWVLGGMCMKVSGWHQLPSGEHAHYVQIVTWDPRAKKYHSWFFSDMGETGEAWWSTDDGGQTFEIKASGRSRDGTMHGKGSFNLVDEDTMAWTWSERRGGQKFKMKGTSKRQVD